MICKRILVMLGALVVLTLLFTVISCAPSTPSSPPPVKETVLVTVVPPQPTAAPVAPKPPVAVLKVVGVPQNATLPGAITATIKTVTDTAVGPSSAMVAMGTTGLSDVPLGMPVRLAVSAQDPKNTGKPTWSLTKPADSKAVIKDPAAMATEFTPDVAGAYMVRVSLKGDSGTSASQFAFFNTGTYIGVTTGNCKQCHPSKVDEWAKTGHASIVKVNLDTNPTKHYGETCLACHTVGYNVGVSNGGFADVQAKTGWKFPTNDKLGIAGTFDAMPKELQNVANIQCENCHGPASEHVKSGAKVTDVSFDNGACNVCHAGGGHHIKGLEIAASKHSEESSMAWVYPVGADHQECVRCHSGKGYASFIANPTNQAAWNNEMQTVGCATCHDPHSDANPFQLRIAGKPVQVPFEAKSVGLSATCEECHNNRTSAADAVKGSYPHYSSAAEMLSDAGGVTYGATVPNSPHGMMVGAAPIPDPSDKTGKTMLYKGNVPGPCVTCHMTGGLSDAKDPNYMKVGEHSFNMVSPDGKFDYGASCKSCHGDVKDFNLKAKADYDGNGKVEGVQDEVKGLLTTLWKTLEAKGWKKLDSGYPYATIPQNADDKQKNAWYNFRYVYGVMWGTGPDGKPTLGGQGAAAAVHNFKRSVALLQLSLKDLGALPSGAVEMK